MNSPADAGAPDIETVFAQPNVWVTTSVLPKDNAGNSIPFMHPTLYSEAALDCFIKSIKSSYFDPLGNAEGRFLIKRAEAMPVPPLSPAKPSGTSKAKQRSKSKSKPASTPAASVKSAARPSVVTSSATAAQTSKSASKPSRIRKSVAEVPAPEVVKLGPKKSNGPKPKPRPRYRDASEDAELEVEPRLVGTRSGAVFDLAIKKSTVNDKPLDWGESDGGTIASDPGLRSPKKSRVAVAVTPEAEDFSNDINAIQSSDEEDAEKPPSPVHAASGTVIGGKGVETWSLIHPQRMPMGRKENTQALMSQQRVSLVSSSCDLRSATDSMQSWISSL